MIRPRRQIARRRAFSLMELIVSMSIMTIIMGAVGSAIMIAAKAIPSTSDPADAAIESQRQGSLFTSELSYATRMLTMESHRVSFTVADRDGDGNPEKITYAWSGTAGDPLTRQYNGGTAQTVVSNVKQFDLLYTTRGAAESYPGGPVATSESLLAYWDGSNNLGDEEVKNDKWWVQGMTPTLASGALSWNVTRIYIMGEPGDKSYTTTTVELHATDASGYPTSTIYDTVQMPTSTMADGKLWREVDFTSALLLPIGQKVALVLANPSSDRSMKMGYYKATPSSTVTPYAKSSNLGGSWFAQTDRAMRFYLFGTSMVPGPTQTVTRTYATAVSFTLVSGVNSTRIDSAVALLNTPQIVSAMWDLDFSYKPTAIDLDANGAGDWVRSDGGAFNAGSLASGVWYADSTLNTYPSNDLTQITTIDVRYRNTSIGGSGAVVAVNGDFSGSNGVALTAALAKQSNNTQTFTLNFKYSSTTTRTLVSIPGLPTDFVHLRLILDPAKNSVNVKLNDTDFGTYGYSTCGLGSVNHGVSLYASGSSAEFDAARIIVGGS
ncbi:MAG: prepilin-type N-terminal cleavage/methylation domain-containing protein [Planctomycetes bacterium]|nr:prepilin-type N-terminal cleavage/methylation domain-containing protein [Planctomycetota bacterium]